VIGVYAQDALSAPLRTGAGARERGSECAGTLAPTDTDDSQERSLLSVASMLCP
jgi:hypothetical protein